MAFEKAKAFVTEKWNAVTDWYQENEYDIWETGSWLVGCMIGGYISSKLGLIAGESIGYAKGYDAGQKNAINVITDFNRKA